MYEHNRYKQYSHLRNMNIKNVINSCLHLINRIKEHRHDKIKTRQIDKFECLFFKKHGYHHNFTRGLANLDNISQVSLSRHSQNLPSNSSSNTSNASSNSTTPAAPMAPASTVITSSAPRTSMEAPSHTSTRPSHTCINSTNNMKHKWIINLSKPLTSAQESLLARGPNIAIIPKYPQRGLHHSDGRAFFPTPPQET